MLSNFIEKKTDELIKKGRCSENNREIVIYGISAGIELLFFISTVLIIGALFGLLFQSVVFLSSYYFIRTYAGGYHCKSSLNCYLLSSGIVVFALTIIKFTPHYAYTAITIVLLLVSIPIIWKRAPIETINKPLDKEEKKKYREISLRNLIIEVVVVVVLIICELQIYGITVALSLFLASALLVVKER